MAETPKSACNPHGIITSTATKRKLFKKDEIDEVKI
jgi:hypothetical protein